MDQIKRTLYELLFIGTLSKDAFSSLFSRYLIWEMTSSEQCPMEYLTASSLCTLVPKYQKQKGD